VSAHNLKTTQLILVKFYIWDICAIRDVTELLRYAHTS
jgi:hypothetical protein